MDEDKFALVEKIIKDIEKIISKNAELCSFEIVPVEANFQNKTPVLHLESCLGLESWCVKQVYLYCYSEIMDKYFSKPKRKAAKVSSIISDRLTRLLNISLLLNPEMSSLWNKRREMVLKRLLEKTSELQYTKLVLSRKPKCNDAFAYRRWILDLILADESLQSNYLENLANEELYICELASEKSPNNYHSWNHRMWLLSKLKTIEKCIDLDLIHIKEYDLSEKWSSKHVSDFSCFHYRQFCIKNIFSIKTESWKRLENVIHLDLRKSLIRVLATNFPEDITIQASEEDLIKYSPDNLINLLLSFAMRNCKCDIDNAKFCRRLEILFHELIVNNELLRFYNSHETLWYHRRFIVQYIMTAMYDYFRLVRQNGSVVKRTCKKCNADEFCQKQAKVGRYDSDRIYSSVLLNVLISHEKKFIDEMRSANDNYADRHEKYLKFVQGLNNVM